jgi:hypothetical protein
MKGLGRCVARGLISLFAVELARGRGHGGGETVVGSGVLTRERVMSV